MSHKALFIDRDGVINDLVFYPSHGEWESPRTVDDLTIRPGVAEALRAAAGKGWLVFLITNQPSYAKGKCSLEGLQQVHQRVLDELAGGGATVTDSFVCYHHPQSVVPEFGACECRKPSPFFIRKAAAQYDIDLEESWMAGDQGTDIETGRAAGCRTALIKYEKSEWKRGAVRPDLVCADLTDFVQKIHGS
jgi:D-glycero-D-manno-heptose 1,7-bisphosphate phosphatase